MTEKLNFLLIVTDQEYAHQAMPSDVTLTNRDRLHARGVTFKTHQVTNSVCAPFRSVMWTGQNTPSACMIDTLWIEDLWADPEALLTKGVLCLK